jgi:hypothetical protein
VLEPQSSSNNSARRSCCISRRSFISQQLGPRYGSPISFIFALPPVFLLLFSRFVSWHGQRDTPDYRVERTADGVGAWLAHKFVMHREKSGTLTCDRCPFDPATLVNGTGVRPRSLLDVDHLHPLEEGQRVRRSRILRSCVQPVIPSSMPFYGRFRLPDNRIERRARLFSIESVIKNKAEYVIKNKAFRPANEADGRYRFVVDRIRAEGKCGWLASNFDLSRSNPWRLSTYSPP